MPTIAHPRLRPMRLPGGKAGCGSGPGPGGLGGRTSQGMGLAGRQGKRASRRVAAGWPHGRRLPPSTLVSCPRQRRVNAWPPRLPLAQGMTASARMPANCDRQTNDRPARVRGSAPQPRLTARPTNGEACLQEIPHSPLSRGERPQGKLHCCATTGAAPQAAAAALVSTGAYPQPTSAEIRSPPASAQGSAADVRTVAGTGSGSGPGSTSQATPKFSVRKRAPPPYNGPKLRGRVSERGLDIRARRTG